MAEQDAAGRAASRSTVLRPQKSNISDANFPVDAEGRTYHLGTKRGEVANRILSVGSEKRALMLAEYLEPVAPGRGLFMLESSRGFLTITGAPLVGRGGTTVCSHAKACIGHRAAAPILVAWLWPLNSAGRLSWLLT